MTFKFNRSLLALLLLISFKVYAANLLQSFHLSNTQNSARLQFILTEKAEYKAFSLVNPDRLVIDFKNTQLTSQLSSIPGNLFVKSVSSNHTKSNNLLLIFDLKGKFKFITQSYNNKIIFDIYSIKQTKIDVKQIKPMLKVGLTAPVPKDRIPKPIVIVIDPGHGGTDPGAIGKYGVKEKAVALAIARDLADLINHKPGLLAVLTRNGDYFVSLGKRLKVARKNKADIFVSIHADSGLNKTLQGASIFALSRHGATSLEAKWLADSENHSVLDNINLKKLEDKSRVVRSVLIDLAETATITDSLHLGRYLLKSLHQVTSLRFARIEQAQFMVLKSPDIPSILVETGFISNAEEEKKLMDKEYQHQIASALFEGINRYVKNYNRYVCKHDKNSKIKLAAR